MAALVAFTAELLPAVQPWFTHPEVQRRLGGPEWPARELALLDGSTAQEWFRGRRVLRAHSWVLLDDDEVPVAKVGGEVYDRWVRYHGEGPQGSVVSDTRPGPSMGLAYVVDPDRWRTGFGRRALRAVIACPAVADVQRFSLGIDADNLASRRCAESAGFVADDPEPDFEGIVYHHHVRPVPERRRGSRQ